MIKIRLFCAAGMSTGLLVQKMKAAAENKGVDADIEALGITELETGIEGIDVALLGPQVAYKLKMVKSVCDTKQVPIAVIPMRDYGTMNGANVLEFALEMIK